MALGGSGFDNILKRMYPKPTYVWVTGPGINASTSADFGFSGPQGKVKSMKRVCEVYEVANGWVIDDEIGGERYVATTLKEAKKLASEVIEENEGANEE